MNLRHLRFFIVLAEELNFTRAAARLHVAQPALSQQIKALEDRMGTLLFERAARPLRLTDAGAYFFAQAREILDQYAQAESGVRDIGRGYAGWLGIGFTRSAIYSVLPPALHAYNKQHPSVELKLFEMLTEEHERALREHRIHIAIGRQAQPLTDCITRVLLRERLMVVLPLGHRYRHRKRIRLDTLSDDAFILYPNHPGAAFPTLIKKLCADAGFQPNIAHQTFEIQTAIALVAAGLGVTLVGESVVKNGRQDVKYLPLEGGDTESLTTLTCTYRAGDTSPALQDFVEILCRDLDTNISQNRPSRSRKL
ncbi:LysR substrate-binding domain-containing protein [Bordetella muralis]|jgi:LysR family transcriptional regulator, benzoate and cis,cis-muconate-responsive activator of ben and cat genes|uniref:LysR substrate-binding domain-containing protein n=1 Tax=Bordetella muralis TaxID=1649130 RepID=UPI0039F06AA6